MKPNQVTALVIGIIGLIIMYFFPSPQLNFLYYSGFVIITLIIIILILKFGGKNAKTKKE